MTEELEGRNIFFHVDWGWFQNQRKRRCDVIPVDAFWEIELHGWWIKLKLKQLWQFSFFDIKMHWTENDWPVELLIKIQNWSHREKNAAASDGIDALAVSKEALWHSMWNSHTSLHAEWGWEYQCNSWLEQAKQKARELEWNYINDLIRLALTWKM